MPASSFNEGILPAQHIETLITQDVIQAAEPIDTGQIQPASLDLRLGSLAYRLRASFLPVSGKLVQKRDDLCLHVMSLEQGGVLEVGCVYLIPLLESLALPESIFALANPKSSTGRLDVFVRLLTHNAERFDAVEAGYRGELFIEVCPQTFPILVRKGSRLNQLRLYQGQRQITHQTSLAAYLGDNAGDLIGFRAKKHTDLIDVDKIRTYTHQSFWEPLYYTPSEPFILQPGAFYILRSAQPVAISTLEAAEMIPYDPLIGEFRAHYAGFFDPGFGALDPTYGVLEVRNHEMPFILDRNQIVARLVYEKLSQETVRPYGEAGAHYTCQTLKLSKHFI